MISEIKKGLIKIVINSKFQYFLLNIYIIKQLCFNVEGIKMRGLIFSNIMMSILLTTAAFNISSNKIIGENPIDIGLRKETLKEINSSNILYVGGNGPNNYSKIQDAIDDASNGDIVFVYNGTYIENILIEIQIKIQGENKSTTIIQGKDDWHTVNIKSSRVNLTDFTISNGGDPYAGVNSKGDYNSFYNVIITDNNFYGIQLLDSLHCILNKCEVSNNYNTGIIVSHSKYTTIINTDILFNNRGLDLYYSSNNNISDNFFENNYNALGLFWGKQNGESTSYNIIKGNIITNNMMGISSAGHKDGEVSYNIITENYIAFNKGKPGAGIVLGAYTSENKVHHNILIDNIDIELNWINNGWDHGENNHWYEGEAGNYWSDYKERYPKAIPKILKPWIWNKPYEIDGWGSSIDRYPFINENLKSKNICQYKNQRYPISLSQIEKNHDHIRLIKLIIKNTHK